MSVTDPATGDVIAEAPAAGVSDTEDAIHADGALVAISDGIAHVEKIVRIVAAGAESVDAALAAAEGMSDVARAATTVRSLQEFHAQ